MLGRSVCKSLISNKVNVYAIVHNNSFKSLKNVNYINIDLTSLNSETKLPREIDCIIHLAQSSNFRKFPELSQDIFNVNVASTSFLLDYAHKVGARKFFYASSGGVYGKNKNPFKENDSINKNDGFYLNSKVCGEILVNSYSTLLQTSIFRPFFIYGKGQDRSMLIPRIFDSVKTQKPILIEGDKGIRINPIHVEDASSAILATLDKELNGVFNIAGPDVLSIHEIANLMGEFLNRKPYFKYSNIAPKDLIGNIELMKKKLVSPKRNLKDYLEDINY